MDAVEYSIAKSEALWVNLLATRCERSPQARRREDKNNNKT
jgi:hypothetical protein